MQSKIYLKDYSTRKNNKLTDKQLDAIINYNPDNGTLKQLALKIGANFNTVCS